jgi:triosephosphate isomerase
MVIVANWKAYVEDIAKAKKLYTVAKRLARETRVQVVLAPAAPFIGLLAPKNTSRVAFASQDISHTTGGPQTGESSAQIFTALGVTYTLLGHSERRAKGESASDIATKIGHAIAHGLTPILCVGEQARDTDGKYLTTVRDQITSALSTLEPKDRTRVIIAYEPVWTIGKAAADAIGVTDLSEMTLYIRKVLAELFPGKRAANTTVLYGGSVEPENIRGLAGGSGVDGFLVGHASVDPKMFAYIIRAVS